jgi:hypothetical protein
MFLAKEFVEMKRSAFAVMLCVLVTGAAFGQTYSNGSIVTHPGGGFGGADASALQNPPLTVFGPTASPAFRLADDFTVPCNESWTINSITAYGYQTQAAAGPFSTVSTLTGGNYRIWSGKPGVAGSSILFDFSGASQMTATGFSNAYRVTLTTLTNQQRPVFTCQMQGNGIVLNPGTYWLDYQLQGTGTAAVFTPYLSTLGTFNSGNAIQFNTMWNQNLNDSGFDQGVPFLIDHATGAVPCFSFDITQPGGPGTPVTLADTGGTPFNAFINLITLNGTNFPNGWLFGLDLSTAELAGILTAGPPFTGTLDFAGNFIVGPIPVTLPFPIPVYYVGIELAGSSVVRIDSAKTITLQ